jgi:hypothetical protein
LLRTEQSDAVSTSLTRSPQGKNQVTSLVSAASSPQQVGTSIAQSCVRWVPRYFEIAILKKETWIQATRNEKKSIFDTTDPADVLLVTAFIVLRHFVQRQSERGLQGFLAKVSRKQSGI